MSDDKPPVKPILSNSDTWGSTPSASDSLVVSDRQAGVPLPKIPLPKITRRPK